ncbi:hypothetical protein JCM8547_007469 [Rhodosporidiobolus lusitaniae]
MATYTDAQFQKAVKIIGDLPKDGPVQPSQDDKLTFYGLFKQAGNGDNDTPRPGMLDFVGKAKHDAWTKQKGKSADQAKSEYVAHFLALLDKDGSEESKKYKAEKAFRKPVDEDFETYAAVLERLVKCAPGDIPAVIDSLVENSTSRYSAAVTDRVINNLRLAQYLHNLDGIEAQHETNPLAAVSKIDTAVDLIVELSDATMALSGERFRLAPFFSSSSANRLLLSRLQHQIVVCAAVASIQMRSTMESCDPSVLAQGVASLRAAVRKTLKPFKGSSRTSSKLNQVFTAESSPS